MQISITLFSSTNMNTKYMLVLAAMAVMLIGAPTLVTDSAFATKRENNQATAQTNSCGNDFEPTFVFCQNLNSQIQGDENSAALVGQQD